MSKSPLRLVGKDASAAVRVLIVEDDKDQTALTTLWLEGLGYATATTTSPHEALRLLAEERFDILFSDVAMPGSMDGVALANKVKSQFPKVRLLLTSSYSDRLLVDFDLPAPLLRKPYGKDDLAKAMALALG
jgi:CheY-like chemotaxis protein